MFINFIRNKRYRDIFEQFIYRGEKTPFTIGTLVICALCFLLLIVATFTQFTITHPWLRINPETGLEIYSKVLQYSPQIPMMIFVIYFLGRNYSLFVYIIYMLVGFFIWPIFLLGGGIEYVYNYLFGYILACIFAIIISGTLFGIVHNLKTRLISAVAGVVSIHIFGFLYSFILAIFKVIDFSMLPAILNVITGGKILYDLFFSILVILIAPYIKNIFWVCMKPIYAKKKKR